MSNSNNTSTRSTEDNIPIRDTNLTGVKPELNKTLIQALKENGLGHVVVDSFVEKAVGKTTIAEIAGKFLDRLSKKPTPAGTVEPSTTFVSAIKAQPAADAEIGNLKPSTTIAGGTQRSGANIVR